MNEIDGKSQNNSTTLPSDPDDLYYRTVSVNVTNGTKFVIDGLKHFTLYQIKVCSDWLCGLGPTRPKPHNLCKSGSIAGYEARVAKGVGDAVEQILGDREAP